MRIYVYIRARLNQRWLFSSLLCNSDSELVRVTGGKFPRVPLHKSITTPFEPIMKGLTYAAVRFPQNMLHSTYQ